MKEEIKEMFDETYLSHFKIAYETDSNFQFLNVLDYIIEAVKSINNEGDLDCFLTGWIKIKSRIESLSKRNKHIARFSKIDEIDKYLLLLQHDKDLFKKQIGFDKFFKERYKKLYDRSLVEKQDSIDSDERWSQARSKGEALGLSPWLFLE